MNKIESIFYFEMNEIPTLTIDIINKGKIESNVEQIFHPFQFGWVARSGGAPSPKLNSKPDGFMPWHATKPLSAYSSPDQQLADLTLAVERIYSQLSSDQVVFLHHQRKFDKSGVLVVNDRTAVVEAVLGWPEALSHGKVDPIARYEFRMPSLFLSPLQVKGDPSFLSQQELSMIGRDIERRLDYQALLGFIGDPVAVEFSFGDYKFGYGISAHDIQAGKSQKFQNWYDLAKSITSRAKIKGGTGGLSSVVEEAFVKTMSLLDSSPPGTFDQEIELLARKYALSMYDGPVPTTLGAYQFEKAAQLLLSPTKSADKIMAYMASEFERKLIEEGIFDGTNIGEDPFADDYMDCIEFLRERGYAVSKTEKGVEVIYPTEALLINQKIPQRQIIQPY
ncbi:MAG: hypothetical protein HGA85_03890 [Nanoarchaeota archaeon]|nr:hypothetical protein [Nanoarchaeota archaeon]